MQSVVRGLEVRGIDRRNTADAHGALRERRSDWWARLNPATTLPAMVSASHSTNWLTFGKPRPIFNHMVELEAPRLDAIFHALGDATRRQMLRDLARGERTVGQLAEPFAMSLAAVSKHIRVLERAGLVRRVVNGREHVLSFDARALRPADEWIGAQRAFWERRLDALEGALIERRARRKRS